MLVESNEAIGRHPLNILVSNLLNILSILLGFTYILD
jgi:hypothetical protein